MAVSPQEASKLSNLRAEVLDLKTNVLQLRNKLESFHLPSPPSSNQIIYETNKVSNPTKIIVVVTLLYIIPISILFLFFYQFGCAPISILILGYLICLAIAVLGIFQLISLT